MPHRAGFGASRSPVSTCRFASVKGMGRVAVLVRACCAHVRICVCACCNVAQHDVATRQGGVISKRLDDKRTKTSAHIETMREGVQGGGARLSVCGGV